MVVTERRGGVMDSSTMWTSQQQWDGGDDDDDSNSSDYTEGGRKRKISSAGSAGEEDEREQKRRKNREAAKRCRDKKQQQTDDLRKKNGELEQENCTLVKQRDELIAKCREYQREIDQHKQQGCMVPHFDPPYDLNTILNPDTPPSHSPSLSPAPPPARHAHAHHHPHHPTCQGLPGGQSGVVPPVVPTLTPAPSPSPTPPAPKVHFLRVKKKDGTTTTLQLSHEDYVKVSGRLHALKLKKHHQQQLQQQQLQQQQQPPQSLPTTVSGQGHDLPFMPQMPHDPPVNPHAGMDPPHADEEEDGGGGRLDTVDDLISVLQNNVKAGQGQYELVPVNPNDVLPNGRQVLVKEEPADSGYEHSGLFPVMLDSDVTEVKQEAPRSAGPWSSTAEQIRAGMDTLAQHDDPSPSPAHIQNIVHFLEHDDQFTVTVTDPKTSRVLEQTTARTLAGTAAQRVTSDPSQPVTYIMTSAPMGSLGICSTGAGQRATLTQQGKVKAATGQSSGVQSGVTGTAMQNVKLRPSATAPRTVPTPGIPGTKPGGGAKQVPVPSGAVSQLGRSQGAASQANRPVTTSLNGGVPHTSAPSLPAGSSRQAGAAQQPQLAQLQQGSSGGVVMTTSHKTISSSDMAAMQLQMSGSATSSSDNLMTTSTRQISDYLNNHSIESLQLQY